MVGGRYETESSGGITFDTLREKCSVSYLKREEATKDSDIPADLQFSHLDTRDDYYLALRHLHCI